MENISLNLFTKIKIEQFLPIAISFSVSTWLIGKTKSVAASYMKHSYDACIITYALGYSQKKIKRGVEDILFLNPPGFLIFFTLPLEIPDKNKASPPRNSTKLLCYTPWKF